MNKRNKTQKKKILIIILAMIIIFIGIVEIIRKNEKYIELTQLKDNSANQMMGYIIKTSTGNKQ